jgi:hypothetical protein
MSDLQGRPRTACRLGQVAEVGNEETAGVGVYTLQSDTLASVAGGIVQERRLGADVDLVVGSRNETEELGVGGGLVLDVATGGVDISARRGAECALYHNEKLVWRASMLLLSEIAYREEAKLV